MRGRTGAGILLVEDHRLTRTQLSEMLKSAFPDCRVGAAETTDEALRECRRAAPAVMVTDIHLPDSSGIELVRLVLSQFPDIRVVMHSNHDLEIFREQSAAAGACAFVSKASGPAVLLAEIDRLLKPAA